MPRMLHTVISTTLTRLSSLAVLTLALGGLFAAPAFAFGPQEGGSEEEDFYRASDPEDPAVAGKAQPRLSLIRGGGGLWFQLNDDRGFDSENEAQIAFDYMYNVMPKDSIFTLDVGVGFSMLAHNWESEVVSVAEFLHRTGRYAMGVDISKIPGTPVPAKFDGDTLVWAISARVQADFFPDSPFDLSASFELGGGGAQVYGRFDQMPGTRNDGNENVTIWQMGLGGEVGYTFGNNIMLGARFELMTINSTSSSDRLLLQSLFRLGAYVGYRF